jgi:dTDP-4-amino-4,6-dideoxygalactose transaminase
MNTHKRGEAEMAYLSNIPAHAGGTPIRDTFLPFCKPYIGDEEKNEVIAALESGWLSTGPRTKQFELEMQNYVGARHSVALSSCTAGLHVALVAGGIQPGDEVITSPFTFVSTANVILHLGARPVFVDIHPETYNMDVSKIEERITSRAKAIIPVHYAGQACDMDPIMELARKHNLLVIEDAAHGIGTKYKGQLLGSWDDRVTIFSFYATKTMTTGEGGLLATGIEEIANKARILSLHGITHDAWKRYSATGSWYYEVVSPGYKYNMTDIQAALGLCQLKRLEGFIARREEICQTYNKAFELIQEIVTPLVSPDARHARYIYPILVQESMLKINRSQFIDALRAENLGTSVHFIPVHLHPYYRETFGYKRGDYPVTESVYDRLISLPLFPHMNIQDVQDTIKAVERIVRYYRN